MNRLLVYFLFFLFSIKAWTQSEFSTKTIQILPTSELSIKGDTNISEFGCVFNTAYLEKNRVVTYKQHGNAISFNNAVLSLQNKGFNCGNNAINKDFHSLLNTKEYPIIILELTKITFIEKEKAKAYVKITIAGKKKEYSLPIDIHSSTTFRFIGKLKLNIKDFNLEPPKKMFGLIVIKEEIEIAFDLGARL